MTERQHHLALRLQSFLRGDRPDAPTVLDDDVANAARALAETYETSSRGIIYEHKAGTPTAERLSAELRTLVESQRSEGLQLTDSEVSLVLRAIETGSREARAALPGDKTAYLELLKRVLRAPSATAPSSDSQDGEAPQGAENDQGSGLIVPGR